MKSFNILLVFLVLLVGCKNKHKPSEVSENAQSERNFASFGKLIDYKGAIGSEVMLDQFQSLRKADTLETKFSAIVTDVCKSKGCWMKLNLKNGEEVMVKFKDYGFFVPMDIEGREVVVNGIAFVDNMSVEDQRHYAKDAGESPEDIKQIKLPKKTFEFEADGVLIGQ
ncbi:DUF4920 domain-containing protein [uncultured Eudoraea sp.]|jgi:hypothetical protein|uniref:DUF4920 domain-containing protein n=1 Tax=uncultured Eudoraea sp. TaxID=1035614 RepID=UPI00261B02B7|nr:DUF4920 domain-containing protein [uncultured Eudoraea sp.]